LKRKADALKGKFRQVMIELLDSKNKMGEDTSESLLLMAKAQYGAGEFSEKVIQSVKRASFRVEMSQENIAGVMLPIMKAKEESNPDCDLG
jgi:V-type H+-transporting ATPase subunit D